MQEENVRHTIEPNLQRFVKRGSARKAGDVDACLRCRASLAASEQQIFDELLAQDTFADAAAESVEVLSAREQTQDATNVPVGASRP